MKISEKIKDLRSSENLTQAELGRKLNMTGHNVFDWEKGKCEPSIDMIIKIAEVFGVSVGYLVGAEDESGRAVPQELSEREKKILKLFGSLTELEQDKLIADAEFYAGRHSSGIIPKRIG